MIAARTIAEFIKNNSETVRIALVEYGERHLCDIRILADAGAGERAPTRRGICIQVGLIPSLVEALLEAEREASR